MLNRFALVGLPLAGILWWGCEQSTIRRCSDGCLAGTVCDVATGLCVADDQKGEDAGSGADAGLATDAGHVGQVDCPAGCSEWQTCQPGGGGACQNLSVFVESPLTGLQVTGGERVRLRARVTKGDGSLYVTATIPARASAGVVAPSSLISDGTGRYEGDFVLPATGGTHTLSAGWPAAQATIEVVTRWCALTCQPWERCVASLDGGSCEDRNLSLAWVRPTSGEIFGPAQAGAVPLRLMVSDADGGFAGNVPYLVEGRGAGELILNGGQWRATLDAGLDEGERRVVAGWSGGPSATQTFRLVTTAPTVTLVAQPPPTRVVDDTDLDGVPRWKKSEVAKFQVESNRELKAISVNAFTNIGARIATSCTRSCPADKYCYCYELDLAQQALNAAVGEVTVSLSAAEDVYGNVVSGISGINFPVTRFQWKRALTGTVTAYWPLAIKANGNLVLATIETDKGELVQVTPEGSMTSLFASTKAKVSAGPVIGAQGDVYVGLRDTSNDQVWLARNPGSEITAWCAESSGMYLGGLALVNPGPDERPVSAIDNRLVVGASPCLGVVVGSVGTMSRIVVSETTAYLAALSSQAVWKVTSINTAPTAAGSSTTTLSTTGLFVVGSSIVGGTVATASSGGAFLFSDNAPLPASISNSMFATTPMGLIVVGGTSTNPVAFFGDNGWVLRRVPISSVPEFGSPTTSAPLGGSGVSGYSAVAPLLGRGDKLYFAGVDGIRVVNSVTLEQEWQWGEGILPTDVLGIAQLNLDINRLAADPCGAGQPGVLYVAAGAGSSTTLYALLVDSAGLPRDAPWPRYQHDPANTGNNATSLVPWTCP